MIVLERMLEDCFILIYIMSILYNAWGTSRWMIHGFVELPDRELLLQTIKMMEMTTTMMMRRRSHRHLLLLYL